MPDIRRARYEEILARYQGGFEFLAPYDPAFVSTFPRWTHLWEFAKQWCGKDVFETRITME